MERNINIYYLTYCSFPICRPYPYYRPPPFLYKPMYKKNYKDLHAMTSNMDRQDGNVSDNRGF